MKSYKRSIFVVFALVLLLYWGELLLWHLLQRFINVVFPKEPNIFKVRNMEGTKAFNGEIVLDFIGLVERHGYPAEEHKVTTEDGYNLLIHRISGSPLSKNRMNKKIVFLQHGFLLSSDSWVLVGPGKDLVFLLADEGYDVWLGNTRGNSYGRSHVNLTTYDRDFWQFSFDEIGTQDLPATIDYVLNHTNQQDLHYIGYSLGTTYLFVLLSMKPEYNTKIKLATCMSPMAFWTDMPLKLKKAVDITSMLEKLLNMYEVYDVLPQSSLTVTIGKLCGNYIVAQSICTEVGFQISGYDPMQINITLFPNLLSHFPAGGSLKTITHTKQMIATHNFQAFDYGEVDNYKYYKQKTPIIYDLGKVTVPIALFYSANDNLAREPDVMRLCKHLPNIVLMERNAFKSFNHMDYMWAIDGKTLLYDRVIQVIQRFDANLTTFSQRAIKC